MSKGLKNPVAIAAATTGAEMAVKGAPKAAKAAGQRVDKTNRDTGNTLSWLIVIGLAAGIYTVWKITKPARKGGDALGDAIGSVSDVIKEHPLGTDEVPVVVGTPAINETQAQFIAESLFDAMRGPGTDFRRIKDALTGLTLADFTLVAKKFGLRRYGLVGGESWPAPLRNLYQWLNRELRNAQIAEIKMIIPGLGV